MIPSASRLAVHTASRSIRSAVRLAARSGAPSASTRALSAALSVAYSGMSSMRRYSGDRYRLVIGQVRGGADRGQRLRRVQRVDQDEVRAQLAPAPGRQVGQVPQVTVSPGLARAYRVQLHREAPRLAPRPGGHRPGGPVLGGGRGPVVTQGGQYGGQRLVADRHLAAPPVPVGHRHAALPGPADELCPSCHRTSQDKLLTSALPRGSVSSRWPAPARTPESAGWSSAGTPHTAGTPRPPAATIRHARRR